MPGAVSTLPRAGDRKPDPEGPEAVDAVGRSRLDLATLTDRLDHRPPQRWVISLCTAAGEATVVALGASQGHNGDGVPDPERARLSSLARSRKRIRQYCVANRLDRLATLTFGDEPDLDGGWRAVEAWRRELERQLGRRLPMVVAPDWGEQNGRLHFHVALGAYVPKELLERSWGRGFVDVRKLRARRPGARAGARLCATYVALYVGKESEHLPRGRRRYSVTKGCQPERVSILATSLRHARYLVRAALGDCVVVSGSDDWSGWTGPPCYLVQVVDDVGEARPWRTAERSTTGEREAA
jgi:hypothetical protein